MPDRAYQYVVDLEGRLWHDGYEQDDPQILSLFMKDLELLPDGRFRVLCMGEVCYVTAEDCPYVIQKIEPAKNRVRLLFPGGYSEELDPTTLEVGEKNVLYCKVRGGKFRARFNRTSYLDLAKFVKFDSKKNEYYLPLSGKRFLINFLVHQNGPTTR